MPILNENDIKTKEKIDEFLKNDKYSNLHQSFEWTKLKSDKWISKAVYIEENNKIRAVMMCLIRKIGFCSMIYAPRGPVCDIYNIKIVNKLVNETKILVKKYRAFCIVMDPEVEYDTELEEMYRTNGYKVKNNVKDILELMQPIKSMQLNIKNKNILQTFSNFNSKTKYNIRLATKKGVIVRFSRSEEYLKKFYKLMKITGTRNQIPVRCYEYYKNLIKSYKDMSRIYISEYHGEALSAAITIKFGKTVTYLYGASSNEKRNMMPNYLMQQNMIEWAINSKCEKYDFGGVFNTTDDNGLYRFKKGFCGDKGCKKFIGEIIKVYNKPYYLCYNKLFPIIEHIIVKK